MNSDTFKARLQIAMGSESQRSFAPKCHVSTGTLHNFLNGKTTPDLETLHRIADVSGYSLAWLASGEGSMKRGEGTEGKTAGPVAPVGGEPGEGYIQVPRYDIAASAGGGAVVHSEQVVDYLMFRTEWVQESLRVDPRHLALIKVIGDSMAPTLHSGDLVLVDTSDRRIAAYDIYVVQFMGDLLVKRIQAHLDGTVSIISDNTIYAPETVRGENLNSLNVIGRVVWYGRRA